MARILVIEDEPDLQTLLRVNLEHEGHRVRVAGTGADGLHELRREPTDLVLLDLMLPDGDGLEVCRSLRADPVLAVVPVIMVTAKGDEADVVAGLGLGAADYVAKPFRIRELMARVKARLGHSREEADAERRRIAVAGLRIDPLTHRVAVDGVDAALTLTEFRLLHLLVRHPGVPYGRYDLIERIRDGDSAITDRTVDVHIRNLRAKIRPFDHLIETVRGVGYRFAERAEG